MIKGADRQFTDSKDLNWPMLGARAQERAKGCKPTMRGGQCCGGPGSSTGLLVGPGCPGGQRSQQRETTAERWSQVQRIHQPPAQEMGQNL